MDQVGLAMGRCGRMALRGDDGFWCLRRWDRCRRISWETGLIEVAMSVAIGEQFILIL